MRLRNSCLVLGGILVTLFSCAHPKGRIMDEGEKDIVGARRAGAPTYDRLIQGAVQKLLGLYENNIQRVGPLKVAFLGVETKGIEELGDWRAHIYELIDTSINRSGRFRTISDRFVRAALRESRVGKDDLFLPRGRRAFCRALEAQNMPIDCLVFATITTGTTRGEGAKQRNYMLTLEIVDVKTGWNDKVSQRIRKEYR